MPFDALVMRGVTAELAPLIVGGSIVAVRQWDTTVFLTGESPAGGRWDVECGLNPRFRRVLRASGVPRQARPSPWAARLLGGVVVAATQPPWERCWHWTLHLDSELDRSAVTLILELSGHLTNLLWIRDDGRVGDAWRRVAPDRPGRAIWPGEPYAAPPEPANPCLTGLAESLPPWARREVEQGRARVTDFCRAYEMGQLKPHLWPSPDGAKDLWAWAGPDASPSPKNWSDTIRDVIRTQEREALLTALRQQAAAGLRRRIVHLEERIAETRAALETPFEPWKALGDTLLASASPTDLSVPSRIADVATGEPLAIPTDWQGLSFQEAAQRAYQRFKKGRARREASRRLLPRLEAERQAARDRLAEVAALRDERALRALLPGEHHETGPEAHRPFRRYESLSGFEIWVGRTELENQALTFREARPDDVWFHVKQYSGSHVVLRCGKKEPGPEDIRDAAELAAHFSRARQGSMIPVDYTPRKFVRKRPHGGPGQVLYSREKTYYVTPDLSRLERLGAKRDRLGE